VDKRELLVPEISQKLMHAPNHAKGILACMLSHVTLLRQVRALKIPAVCVFEDDVILCEDFKQRIEYIESLPSFDFDFFALGGHFSTKADRGGETRWKHIRRIYSIGGTYAYVMTERVIDFFLRNVTYQYGADEFFSNFIYSRFNSYAFVPFLAGCVPGKSEITDSNWDYENIGWTFDHGKVEL